jgi:ribonuclease HII
VEGLADSKALTEARRDALAVAIRGNALAWAVALATPAEIDEINILQASLLAMSRAIAGLAVAPDEVAVDGLHVPRGVEVPCRAIVKGDRLVPAISAASILAKTARDAQMVEMESRHPGYGFAKHKGYPTPEHLEALSRLGPCEIHRRSFSPVRLAIAQRALAF